MNPRPPTPSVPFGRREAPSTDGRRLRSERTRLAIVEAYIELLREDPRIPTAATIAERAGYSVRSLFERFPDMLALRTAATDHAFAVGNAQAPARDADGDRATRIRSQVWTRSHVCENWLPLWRALQANHGEAAELKIRIDYVRRMVMARMEHMYAPELAVLDEMPRRRTLYALEALTDFESWGRMRELYKLTIEEARGVWIRAIDRLLPPTPGQG